MSYNPVKNSVFTITWGHDMKARLLSLLFLAVPLAAVAVTPTGGYFVVVDWSADPRGNDSFGSVFLMDPEGDPIGNTSFITDSYDYFWNLSGVEVERGSFGASMKVRSINAGPICILLDSRRTF